MMDRFNGAMISFQEKLPKFNIFAKEVSSDEDKEFDKLIEK